MPHWCCMSGRITTIFVLFPTIDNLCFTGVVFLVGLQLFLYCSLWLIIYASLVLYFWSDCDSFCTVPYDCYSFFTGLVLSGRMTTIVVLFSMFDNLCLAHVVCPVSQVKYSDVAILGCWCGPRSARALTVSCWTGLLVPLQESGNRFPVNIIKSSDCMLWFTGLETTTDDVPVALSSLGIS